MQKWDASRLAAPPQVDASMADLSLESGERVDILHRQGDKMHVDILFCEYRGELAVHLPNSLSMNSVSRLLR